MLQLRDTNLIYEALNPVVVTEYQSFDYNENGSVYPRYIKPKEIAIPPDFLSTTTQTTRKTNEKYKTSKHLNRRRRYAKHNKIGKKSGRFIVPALIGFLTATSLLIPFGIKALILVATKAIVLVLLSILTALFIRLRGAFASHDYQRRADRKSEEKPNKNPYDISYYYKRKS